MIKILNFVIEVFNLKTTKHSEISLEKCYHGFIRIVFKKVDTVSVLVHDWVAWSSWSP